jgi:hypothetical protein
MKESVSGMRIADVGDTFISSAAQLLQYAVAGLCCPNKLKHEIGRDTTNIIALRGIAFAW